MVVNCIVETTSCADGRDKGEDGGGIIWIRLDKTGKAP